MDPLAGLFVLWGLAFDVIGVILLVSIIISIKADWTPELLELKKKMGDIANHMVLPTSQEIGSNTFTKERLLEIKESHEQTRIKLIDLEGKLMKGIAKREKELSKSRAFSGLAFLIGGFLLQAIGVVIQLFSN